MKPRAVLLGFYGTLVRDDSRTIDSISRAVSSTTAAETTEVGAHWSGLFSRLCSDAARAAGRVRSPGWQRSAGASTS